jgi:hypothetical protein
MINQLKFIIPVLLLMAMLISGLGLVLSQTNPALAAAPSGNYQNSGATLYCDPDDCPVNNGGVCPGGGPNGTGSYGNCPGARSTSCPCGGGRFTR